MVHVVGTINGSALDVTHEVSEVGVGNSTVDVNFGNTGFDLVGRVFGQFVANPAPMAVVGPLSSFRLTLEAPDPLPGIELCSDNAAEGIHEHDRAGFVAHRLVELVCPGTPVSGTLDLSATTLSGTVDGMTIDSNLLYNVSGPGTQDASADDDDHELNLATNDAAGTASTGQVSEGHLEIQAPLAQAIYCTGSASFTRSPAGAATAHFSGLSKIGSCTTAPSVGNVTVCAQDPVLDFP